MRPDAVMGSHKVLDSIYRHCMVIIDSVVLFIPAFRQIPRIARLFQQEAKSVRCVEQDSLFIIRQIVHNKIDLLCSVSKGGIHCICVPFS